MVQDSETWLKSIQKGVQLVLFDGVPLNHAARITNTNHITLKKYIDYCQGMSKCEISQIVPFPTGRTSYLSKDSVDTLKLFVYSMDFNGLPMGQKVISDYVRKLHELEFNLNDNVVHSPDTKTLQKYEKEAGILILSVCEGPGVDALRETKATAKYLCDYFDKLESVLREYKVKDKNV